MKDLRQFFSYMHGTDFPYVVLRNWENLPDEVESGIHSDLDLLVYDFDHFMELFKCELQYPYPRVRVKLPIDNKEIYADIRHIGDGYYPTIFQRELLQLRMMHERGFYTPDPLRFKIALAYHVVHHKNSNTYPKYLGNLTVEELLKALQESVISYSIPDDPTVGRYNQYNKGSTSIIKKESGRVIKTQNLMTEFDLLQNEKRILERLDNKHFPKLFESSNESLEIEDCGAQLRVDNLPPDWRDQLQEIVDALRESHVVHRDIRPNNLLVKDGVIKLIDFGWARLSSEKDEDVPYFETVCKDYKPSYGFDDLFSIKKIAKEFDFKLQERESCTS